MFLHTWCWQGLCKLGSCATFALNSHWAELPQARKALHLWAQASVVSNSLQPCRLRPGRLLCKGGGFSRQEYWSVWANTGCHTLLEHYISCCPSHQLPWVAWCWPEPLRPKQLHHLHTWPSQGQTKSSRAVSGVNPSGQSTCRGGNKTISETQEQCG